MDIRSKQQLSDRQRRGSTTDRRLTMTAHEAVLARRSIGRPLPVPGWLSIGAAVARYEPSISMFAADGWTAEQVWRSATGSDATPDDLTASGVLAIIDVAQVHASNPCVPGSSLSVLFRDPMWSGGARTHTGEIFDETLKGLNMIDWRFGLAVQFHRRYSPLHGRHNERHERRRIG